MLQSRPTTPSRAAAAQRNGAKSHGPISAAGKSKITRNNLRHGLYAQTLNPLNEDPATVQHHETLLTNLLNQIDTTDPTQLYAARILATATAEQSRIWELEDQALREELHRLAPANPDLTLAALEALALQTLIDRDTFLDLCHRRGSRCDRLIHRAIALLHFSPAWPESRNTQVQTAERAENKQSAAANTPGEPAIFAIPEPKITPQPLAEPDPRRLRASTPNMST